VPPEEFDPASADSAERLAETVRIPSFLPSLPPSLLHLGARGPMRRAACQVLGADGVGVSVVFGDGINKTSPALARAREPQSVQTLWCQVLPRPHARGTLRWWERGARVRQLRTMASPPPQNVKLLTPDRRWRRSRCSRRTAPSCAPSATPSGAPRSVRRTRYAAQPLLSCLPSSQR